MISDIHKILSAHVYDCTKHDFGKFTGNYLEIGIYNGVGTAEIAHVFPDRKIYAIDPFIEDGYTIDSSRIGTGGKMTTQKDAAVANLLKYDNATLFEMTSKEFATHLMASDIIEYNVSWVVIDGSHHYEDVVVDAELARRLIDRKQGVIIFDDLQHPGVLKAYNEFKEEFGFRICQEFKIGYGESCGVLELGAKEI